jgi:GT2 family glycosyltransferase
LKNKKLFIGVIRDRYMKKSKLPLVCIIIVNWNGGKVIEECISSLVKKTDYGNYKILLVDNGSTDESVKKLTKICPKMEVIKLSKNYGYTVGINAGWKHVLEKYDSDYVCNMNSDIITVQKDWLSIQIKELEKRKKSGISGGKLVFPDGRFQEMVRKTRRNYSEMDEGQYDFVKEVPAVWGACLIIKKEVIKKIGYLDENFFYGPDDIDYCVRARNAGFKIIYNGFAKVVHIGAFSGLSPKKDLIYRKQSEGMMIYTFRHRAVMEKISMIFRQFLRAFVTRKDPFSEMGAKNLLFHKSFPKRVFLFENSLIEALKNYKTIKQNTPVILK